VKRSEDVKSVGEDVLRRLGHIGRMVGGNRRAGRVI
jgi:hypothetical protein